MHPLVARRRAGAVWQAELCQYKNQKPHPRINHEDGHPTSPEGKRGRVLTVAVATGKFADDGAHEALGVAEEH